MLALSRRQTGQVIEPLPELIAAYEPLRSLGSGFAQRTEMQSALRNQHRTGVTTKS